MRKFLLTLLCLVGITSFAVAEDSFDVTFGGGTANNRDWPDINSYTVSKTSNVKFGGVLWSLTNFNNNNNGWKYIKGGRNGNASVCSIYNNGPLTSPVASVKVTVDAVTAAKINSAKLYIAADDSFSNITETVTYSDIKKGEWTFTVSNPAANKYYKLEFDCLSGTSNGLIQISKVTVTYAPVIEDGAPAAPTFNPMPVGTYYEPVDVTIACETEGATLEYKLGESGEYQDYTSPITLTETTTVYAKATKDDKSTETSATYTFGTTVNDIADMYEKIDKPASSNATSEQFKVGFDAVVVASGNSTTYIYDNAGSYIMIYEKGLAFNSGDVIKAGWLAKLKNYAGKMELIPQKTLSAEGTAELPEPMVINEENFDDTFVTDNYDKYAVLKNAYFVAEGAKIELGDTEINSYNTLRIDLPENNGVFNITGLVTVHNDELQFVPATFEEVVDLQANFFYTPAEMTYNIGYEENEFVAPKLNIPDGVVAEEIMYSKDDDNGIINLTEDGVVTLTGMPGVAAVTAVYKYITADGEEVLEAEFLLTVTKNLGQVYAIINGGDYTNVKFSAEEVASASLWSDVDYTVAFTAINASSWYIISEDGQEYEAEGDTTPAYTLTAGTWMVKPEGAEDPTEFVFTFSDASMEPTMVVDGESLKLGGKNVKKIEYKVTNLTGQLIGEGEFENEGTVLLTATCKVDAKFTNVTGNEVIEDFVTINAREDVVMVTKEQWMRVGSMEDIDTESEYLIGVASSDVVMNNTIIQSSNAFGTVAASYGQSRSTITEYGAEAAVIKFEASANDAYPYFIKLGEDYVTSQNGTNVYKSETKGAWGISFNVGYIRLVWNGSKTPRALLYSSTSGGVFKNYATSNLTNNSSYEEAVLYKKTITYEEGTGMVFTEGPVAPVMEGDFKYGKTVTFKTFEGHHLEYCLTPNEANGPMRATVDPTIEAGVWQSTKDDENPHILEYLVPTIEEGEAGHTLEVKAVDSKNPDNKSESFTQLVNNETTGVANVTVDTEEATVEYYNLQGVRVANPTHGLYIRRAGNRTTKVVL